MLSNHGGPASSKAELPTFNSRFNGPLKHSDLYLHARRSFKPDIRCFFPPGLLSSLESLSSEQPPHW